MYNELPWILDSGLRRRTSGKTYKQRKPVDTFTTPNLFAEEGQLVARLPSIVTFS